MRRVIMIIVAVSCVLLSAEFTASATALEDGAIIYVGLEKMTHEDVEGWTPTGVSGPIFYDEANHVLTLNEVSFTEELDINASAFWDSEFTIRIKGKAQTTFEMQGEDAIRYRGGHGLIIEGEPGTGLSIVVNNNSGYGGCGIMCATTFSTTMSESDYLPLTIQGGISVDVNNYGANESKYAAVIAYPIKITSSDLSAKTTKGTGVVAVQTATGQNGISTTKSQWMNYDEYDDYFWEWKAYTVVYDIQVNGYYLTDRRSSLTKDDMTNITSGTLTYNPETNVLELSGGFELETHDGWSNGISYSGTESLTIKINSYSPVKISEASMSNGHAGLYVKGPVIIDLNGCDLELNSTYGSGLWIQDEVTILNSMGIGIPSDAEKKILTVNSPNGFGIIGDASDAKMTIDRANVVAGGSNGPVIEIPTILNHVALEAGYHWNSMNSVVDEYDAEAADPINPIHFNISAWQLATQVWPKESGHVSISDGENMYENLYYFTGDKNVVMTPVASEGWEFMMWGDSKKDNPRNEKLLQSSGSVIYEADFVRLIESETQWYSVVEVGGKRSIFTIDNKLRELGTSIANLTPTDERSIVCAAFADGYLYYIETNSIGTKSWLTRASFDGTTLGTAEIITEDAQAGDYSFFFSMAYSYTDECFYGVCQRMSDNKNVMVKIAKDGSTTDLFPIADGQYLSAMTIDGNGLVYLAFNADELQVYDPVTDATTKIGKMSELALPGSSSSAMFYDASTEELFVFDDDIFWRVNTTDAQAEPVWVLSALNTNCVFTIEPPVTKYTISVAVAAGEELRGSVSLPGGLTTGKFEKNSSVTLTATPAKGYQFKQWDDGDKKPIRTITVTENKTYTASFKVAEGIPSDTADMSPHIRKVLINGVIYIIQDNKLYTPTGIRVE